ncbi:transporter substrate-binding domain-containing protein [Chitinasiproducens palmae]|uniref:Glutamate/aspartate transport system substrate-binding protein n=1 Tax=Chitinasiproducens palmae TaxID=1770053 RepID=A0A1H2PTL6_9BURK|nr:transporter substrate-binding domain-containing protein [Chitinasiproducens palmae]SDV50081.1 glutamate/aspartate transport system substrate-binding protein [Chitinasiproducens palmae]
MKSSRNAERQIERADPPCASTSDRRGGGDGAWARRIAWCCRDWRTLRGRRTRTGGWLQRACRPLAVLLCVSLAPIALAQASDPRSNASPPSSPSGSADATLQGTLKKISDSGEIVLGVRASSAPLSYADAQGNTIGYSQDIALRIVDAIKIRLHMPDLRVVNLPITSANRMALLGAGRFDLECGSTTHTLEREQTASFSNNIFLYGIKIATRRSGSIRDFGDLDGQRVVTTAGTTSETLLRRMLDVYHDNFDLTTQADHDQSFAALVRGEADAFVVDEPLLYAERSRTAKPSDYVITGTPLAFENYACMFRRGDTQFKQLVDETIARLQRSGQAAAIYRKWFEQPVPPNGNNLRYPMSQELRELFAHPNDRAQH